MLQTTRAQLRLPPAGALLACVFSVLDDAKVPYCVLHGYADYPHLVESDVDCLMPASWLPKRLARLLHSRRDQLGGARVVQWFAGQSHFIVLAGTDPETREINFLHLHVSSNIDVARRRLYGGQEILRDRRRHGEFWIPAARHEFAATLARRIEKQRLSEEHLRHLRELQQLDPSGCAREAERWVGLQEVEALLHSSEAASSGMRTRLLRRAGMRKPLALARNAIVGAVRVAARAIAANRGLNVVILGPDGSGKSSIVESLRQDLAGAFVGSQRRTFPPALLNRATTGVTNSSPHAAKPRSWISSVVRAVGYWAVYYTAGHPFTVGRAKAAGKLVVHDRHLLDCLVDPKRYRYGGPMGLLRLIARVIRKPDLVLLLDAPAEVIQRRKQEVPLDETERQLRAYRKLAAQMRNANIVDVNRPLPDVVETVNEMLVGHLSKRIAPRFGIETENGRPWMEELAQLHGEGARVVASPLADNAVRVCRYAVLPSRHKPRWFVPLESGAVSAAGLTLAAPTKPLARAASCAVRALARTGAPLWYRDEVVVAQPARSAIDGVLQELFPGRKTSLAITLGSPPPTRNRKVSFAVIDSSGEVLAYAKLPGTSAASHESVRAEAAALEQLRPLRLPVPRLLWAGNIDGASYMTVSSPLRGKSAGMRLTAAHHALLARLLSTDKIKCAAQTAFAIRLRERAGLLDGDPASIRILDQILNSLGSLRVPATIVHGDFAPWNLRRCGGGGDGGGAIGAFDWEYATLDGLPLIDHTHHLLAVGYLVGRWSVDRALKCLRDHASERPLGYSAHAVRTLHGAYLIDYMLRLLSEGYERDYGRFAWCRDILVGAWSAQAGEA